VNRTCGVRSLESGVLDAGRTRGVVAILCGLILFSSLPAPARSLQDIKNDDTVKILKRFRDPTPAHFRSVGEDVDRVLVNLLITRRVDADLRIKAAIALGGYPAQRARGALVATLVDPGEPKALRAACMTGLARAFRETVIEDLRPFLKDADPELRAGAARALGAAGGEKARTLLLDSIDHEEILEVRQAMEEGLKLP
jgi:HEAT repeat protein